MPNPEPTFWTFIAATAARNPAKRVSDCDTASDNAISRQDGESVSVVAIATGTMSGGTPSYSQGFSDSSTASVQHSDNDYVGTNSDTTTTADSFSMSETGSYSSVGYSILENDTSTATVQDTGNFVSDLDKVWANRSFRPARLLHEDWDTGQPPKMVPMRERPGKLLD